MIFVLQSLAGMKVEVKGVYTPQALASVKSNNRTGGVEVTEGCLEGVTISI
jgi:hypothetical protein